jgi:hypothetical protein
MQLKLWDEGSITRLGTLAVGVLLGLMVWYFSPRQTTITLTDTKVITKVETVEKVVVQTKTKVVDRVTTVTRPGETITVVEKEAELSSKESTENSVSKETEKYETTDTRTPARPSYSILAGASIDISLQPRYLLGADARIGNLPLSIGVYFETPKPAIGLTLRLEL